MTGFFWGVLLTAAFVAGNNAAKKHMTKIHSNNDSILAKMKIPGYAIYSYIIFLKERYDEKKTA